MIIEKQYKTSHDDIGMPMILIGSCVDYIDTFCKFDNGFFDEIIMLFLSDLKDITFFHYMEHPRSMLCRKLEKNIFEENFKSFDYNWLPDCSGQMNTKFYFIK